MGTQNTDMRGAVLALPCLPVQVDIQGPIGVVGVFVVLVTR